jgi:hypothetical protein
MARFSVFGRIFRSAAPPVWQAITPKKHEFSREKPLAGH